MKLKANKRWKKAIKIIPGGNMLYSKRAEAFLPKFWPTYYSKTKDAYVWDKEGNKYIDMILHLRGFRIKLIHLILQLARLPYMI